MAYYAIVKQEIGTSKISGADTVTMTIFNVDTGDEYRSYIDASMNNAEHWVDVISNPEKGYIVDGLKEKRNYGRYNHDILNADCEPVIVAVVPSGKELEKMLKQHWAKKEFLKTPFGKLFDIED